MRHGRHIKIVGKADPVALGDVARVREFLLGLVARLGMRALAAPQMHDVETDLKKMNVEPFEDEGGVTGVVVLSTSHCSIHTWPLRSFFVLDVYSCRDFETAEIEFYLYDCFASGPVRVTDLSDSLEFES